MADSVVTTYTLDPSGYVLGTRRVTDATNKTSHAIGGFRSVGRGMPQMLGGIGSAFGAVAAGATAAAGAFAAFAMYSINRYAEYNQLRLTFAGIFQDMGKADQMMSALESYGMKSMFPEEALRKGALTLTQARLSVEEFLPVLEILAAKSGDVSMEGLLNAADVLRRIRGGQITEGLGPEGMGRFGINKQDLARLGGKFDKDGGFIGTWQEALALIKAAANESSTILDMMEGSEAAQLSNAMEAVDKAIRGAGQSLSAQFLPLISTAATFATQLANDGVFTKIADEWGKLFNVTDKEGVIGFMATIVATLELMPGIIRDAGNAVADALLTIWKFSPAGFIDEILGRPLQNSVSNLGDTLKQSAGIEVRASQLAKSFSETASSSGASTAFPSVSDPSAGGGGVVAQIEKNTRETARNTSPHTRISNIVGGGDLARQGIPLTERNKGKNGGDEIDQIGNLIKQLVNRHTALAIEAYDRSRF